MTGSDGTSGAYRGPGGPSGGDLESFLDGFRMTTPGRPVDMIHQATIGDTIQKAFEEKRCIKEPMGCGQNLLDENGHPKFVYEDRDAADLYYREWLITGLCGTCQDKVSAVALALENEGPCCDNAPCTCDEAPAF